MANFDKHKWAVKTLVYLYKKFDGRVSYGELTLLSSQLAGKYLAPNFWVKPIYDLRNDERFRNYFGHMIAPPDPNDADKPKRNFVYFVGESSQLKYGQVITARHLVKTKSVRNVTCRFWEVENRGRYCGVYSDFFFRSSVPKDGAAHTLNFVGNSSDEDYITFFNAGEEERQMIMEAAAIDKMRSLSHKNVKTRFNTKNRPNDVEWFVPPTEYELDQIYQQALNSVNL